MIVRRATGHGCAPAGADDSFPLWIRCIVPRLEIGIKIGALQSATMWASCRREFDREIAVETAGAAAPSSGSSKPDGREDLRRDPRRGDRPQPGHGCAAGRASEGGCRRGAPGEPRIRGDRRPHGRAARGKQCRRERPEAGRGDAGFHPARRGRPPRPPHRSHRQGARRPVVQPRPLVPLLPAQCGGARRDRARGRKPGGSDRRHLAGEGPIRRKS